MSPLQSAALQQPQGPSGSPSTSVEPPNPAEERETGAPPHLPRPSVDSPPTVVLPLVPPARPTVVPQESENPQQNQQQKQKQPQMQQQQQRQQQGCPRPQEATANDKQQTHNEIQPPNSLHQQQVQAKQQTVLEQPPQSQQHHQQKEHQGEQGYQEHHHHQQDGPESQQQLLLLNEVGNGPEQQPQHYRNVSQQLREQQTQTGERHSPNEAPKQQQQRRQQRGQRQPALMVLIAEQQQAFPGHRQGTQGLQERHTPEQQHQGEKPAGDQVELLLEAAEQQRSKLRQLVQQDESCSSGHYEQQHSQEQQQQHEQQQQQQQQQHQKKQHQQQQQQQLQLQDLNEQQYEPSSEVDGGQLAAVEGRVPCWGSPESHSTLSREISLSESESSDPATTRSPVPDPSTQQPQRSTYATGDRSCTTEAAIGAAAREGIPALHNQVPSSSQEALAPASQAAETTNSQEAQKPLLEQRQQQQHKLRVQRHAELHQQPQQQVPQHQRQPNNRTPLADSLSHTLETRGSAEPCHLKDILWRQRHQQQQQPPLVGAARGDVPAAAYASRGAAGTAAAAVAVLAAPRARAPPAAPSASVLAMRSPPPVQEESPAAVEQQQPHSASSSSTVALGGPSAGGKLQGPPAPSRGLSGAANQTPAIQASLLGPAAARLAAAAAAPAEPHGRSGHMNSAAEGAKHESLQPAAALPASSAGSAPKKSQAQPAATAAAATGKGTTTKAASSVAALKGATRSSATAAMAKAAARATAHATDATSSETAEGADTRVSPPVVIVNKVAGDAAVRSANAPPRKSSSGFIALRGAASATSEPRAPVAAAAVELLLRQAPRQGGRAGQSEMPPAKKRRQLLERRSEQQLQPQLHRSQKQAQMAPALLGIDKRAIPQLAQPRKLAPTTALSACSSSRSSCCTDSSSSDGTESSRSRRSSDSCSSSLSGSSRSNNNPSSRSESRNNSPSNTNSSSPSRSVKQRNTSAVKLWSRSNGAGSVSSLRRRMLGKLLKRRTVAVSSSAFHKAPCRRNTAISAPAGERLAGARTRGCSTDAAAAAAGSAAAAAAPLTAGDLKPARQGQPSARKEQVPQSLRGPELGGVAAVAAAGKAVPLLQQFADKGPSPAELHCVAGCSSTRNISTSNSKAAHSVPFAPAAPASVCAREPRPPCRGSSTAPAKPLTPVSVRPPQQQPCGASSSDLSTDNVQECGSNTHEGHRETLLEGRPNLSQHQMQENMHAVHAADKAGERDSGPFLETRPTAPAPGQIPPPQCERDDLARVPPALVEASERPTRQQGRPQRPEPPSVVAAAADGDTRAASSRWSCLRVASPRAEETTLVKAAPVQHQPHEGPSQPRCNEAEAPLMQLTEQQQVGVQQQQLVRQQPLFQPLLQQQHQSLHPSQPHLHQSSIGPPQNNQCPQWQQEEQLQQQPQQRLQRASLQQQEYRQHQENESQKSQMPAQQLPRQHRMQHQRQHLLLQHEQHMLHRQEHQGGFPHPGSCFLDISARSSASPVSPMSRLSPVSGASLNRRSPPAWVMRPAVGSRCSPVCGGGSTAGGSEEWQTQPPCSSKGLRTCCVSPAFPRDPLARPAWLQLQRKSPHAVPLGPQGKAQLALAPQNGGAGVAMPCRAASKPASTETAQEAVVSLLKAGGPSIPQNARSRPESMYLQQQQLQQHQQHQQQHLARQRQLRRVKHLFALHTRLHDLLSHAAVVLQNLRDVCCCSLETLSALEGASCCSPGGGVLRTKTPEDASQEAGTPALATAAAAGDGLCSGCNVHLNLQLENNGAENCVCPRSASPVDVSQAEHACASATNRQQQQQQQQHNHHHHQHHQQALPFQPMLHQRFVDTHLEDRTSASNQHQTLLQEQLLPRLQRQGQPQPLPAVQHLQIGKQIVQPQHRQHALQQHQQLHQQKHQILSVADGPVQPQQQILTKQTPQEGPLQPPGAHHRHIKGGQSLLLLQQVPLQQLQVQRAQKRQHLLLQEQLRQPSIHRPPTSQHHLADALVLKQMAVQKAQLQSSPEDLEHQQGSQEQKVGKEPSLRIPQLYSTEHPWLLQLPLHQPLQQPVQTALQPEPNPKKKFGPLQLGRDTQHAESAKLQRQLLQEQTDLPLHRQLLQAPLNSGVPHPPQQQPQPWSISQQHAQQKAHHQALQQVDAPNAGNNIAQPGDFLREQRPRAAHCHHFLLQTGAAEQTGDKDATVSPQKPAAGDPLRSPTTPLTTAESSCGSNNSTSRTSSNSINSTNRINEETVSPVLRESGSAAERQTETKDSTGSVSTCGPSVQPCGEETSGSRRQCYLDAMYRLPLRPKWWYTPLGLSSADRSIQ